MSMPGSSAHAGGHAGRVSAVAYGLLPWSIAIAWIAVLIVVVVAHCRSLIAARGRTRVWHCLHLAMAVTMALMYASGSLVVIGVSGVVWTTVFAASAALAAGMLVTEPRARSVGWLWPLVVVDLIAMTYMLQTGHLVSAISWQLVAYLVAQTTLWAIASGGRLVKRAHIAQAFTARPRHSLAGGALLVTRQPAASPTRASHAVTLRLATMMMTASMAYMLIVMQLST
jgi:hypothetical protein